MIRICNSKGRIVKVTEPTNRIGPQGQARSWRRAWLLELGRAFAAAGRSARRRHVNVCTTPDGLDVVLARGRKKRRICLSDSDAGTAGQRWERLRSELKAQAWSRAPIRVRLGQERVLNKSITLPRAVEGVLEPVLRNQLERLTPWREAETCFGYRVSQASKDDQQIVVDVAATRRPVVDQLRREVQDAGLALEGIDFAPDDVSWTVTLYDQGEQQAQRIAQKLAAMLLILLAVSIPVGTYGLYKLARVHAQHAGVRTEIAELEDQIATIERQAQVQSLQSERLSEIVAEKDARAPVVSLVAALTRAIPDHAWLKTLVLEPRDVRIQGEAGNAAEVLVALERSDQFASPTFSAPTVRETQSGKDHFSIAASVLPLSETGENE